MRVELDGHGLNLEVEGPDDAPPVLFLHGVMANAETYAWLPESVTAGRRVMRLDHRGHGHSDHTPGAYALDDYYGDVVAVLERVAGRPAVVIGQSLGGVIAWRLAQERPDLVVAVVAEDPPLFNSIPETHEASGIPEMIAGLEEMAQSWRDEGLDIDEAHRRFASSPVAPGATVVQSELFHEDAVLAAARAFLQLDPEVQVTARDNRMLLGLDLERPLRVPALLLAADEELGATLRASEIERLAQTHPDVRVVRFAGATHRIHSQRSHRDAYREWIEHMLDEHAPRAVAENAR